MPGKAVRVHDIAMVAVLGRALGADGGYLRPAFYMMAHCGLEVKVCRNIALHHDDILCPQLTHIGRNGIQCLYRAGVIAPVVLRQAERREHSQAADTATHVPVLAAADVV